MRLTTTSVTRYEDGDYLIDIVEDNELFEAWLSHKDYGISTLMFGVPKRQEGNKIEMPFEAFRILVETNLDDYKATYEDEIVEETP